MCTRCLFLFFPSRFSSSFDTNVYVSQGQDGSALAGTEGVHEGELVAAVLLERSVRPGRPVSPVLRRCPVVLRVAGQASEGESGERKMGLPIPDGPQRLSTSQGAPLGRRITNTNTNIAIAIAIAIDKHIVSQPCANGHRKAKGSHQRWDITEERAFSGKEKGQTPQRRRLQDGFEKHSVLFFSYWSTANWIVFDVS